MTPIRRLVYRFLSLAYEVRLRIAGQLGLILDEDKGVTEVELFRRVIARANETDKLAEIWDEINCVHTERAENPFRT